MLSKSVIKRLWHQSGKNTEAFALIIEKAVREQCAVIAETLPCEDRSSRRKQIAEAIRAGGKDER